jgi:GxxExxY protein
MKSCGTGSAVERGMFPTHAHIEHHTEKIIGCAIEVHKTFGAGLLESVYRECLAVELRNAGLCFESERCIKLTYKGMPINSNLFVDLIVEGIVVVELKAVECLQPIHSSQVHHVFKVRGLPGWFVAELQRHTHEGRGEATRSSGFVHAKEKRGFLLTS